MASYDDEEFGYNPSQEDPFAKQDYGNNVGYGQLDDQTSFDDVYSWGGQQQQPQQPDYGSTRDFGEGFGWSQYNGGSMSPGEVSNITAPYEKAGMGFDDKSYADNPDNSTWWDTMGKFGSGLSNVFASGTKSPNTGSPQMDAIMRLLQGGAGIARSGLGIASAQREREKSKEFLDYVQNMTRQQVPAMDPSAGYREIAGQFWKDNNPNLQTLLSGGITANMQQDLNASRNASKRQAGKSHTRHAAFAAREEPYLMAQARANDFKMQQEAQKQRWNELSTRGDTSNLFNLANLNANAYKQSLTNPLYAEGSRQINNFLGQGGTSIDGDTLDRLKTFLSTRTA